MNQANNLNKALVPPDGMIRSKRLWRKGYSCLRGRSLKSLLCWHFSHFSHYMEPVPEPDLLDAGLVQTLMQTASYFAHQDNPDAAKFLVFIARELAHQLGLYPQPQT